MEPYSLNSVKFISVSHIEIKKFEYATKLYFKIRPP